MVAFHITIHVSWTLRDWLIGASAQVYKSGHYELAIGAGPLCISFGWEPGA